MKIEKHHAVCVLTQFLKPSYTLPTDEINIKAIRQIRYSLHLKLALTKLWVLDRQRASKLT